VVYIPVHSRGNRRPEPLFQPSKKFEDRLENIVKGLEQNWFIKMIAILAAIAGVLLFAEEVWRILRQ
jgi:hypothetical protein